MNYLMIKDRPRRARSWAARSRYILLYFVISRCISLDLAKSRYIYAPARAVLGRRRRRRRRPGRGAELSPSHGSCQARAENLQVLFCLIICFRRQALVATAGGLHGSESEQGARRDRKPTGTAVFVLRILVLQIPESRSTSDTQHHSLSLHGLETLQIITGQLNKP